MSQQLQSTLWALDPRGKRPDVVTPPPTPAHEFAVDATSSSVTESTHMSQCPLAPSARSAIRSFKVMDVVARADELSRAGREIYHLEVGQPQSSAPAAAIRVAQEQLASDRCGYTAARGEAPLREAIAAMYADTYPGAHCRPDRVHVTPGSSGAFPIAQSVVSSW